jgi:membrane protein DedA with SNARE-associated domain
MKKNVGTTDKVIRISLAVVLLVLYFTEVLVGTPGIIALVAAGALIATSAVSFCGLYTLLGYSSCPVEAAKK